MFSIYILTYNEERDIAACIESAQLSDDVIVVDSWSSDRTPEIAQRYPVRFVPHAFESHGKQRTWMLRNIPAKHDWVYILEADERMTPELFQECCDAIQNVDATASPSEQTHSEQAHSEQAKVGFFAAERVMFMGQWIRHSTQYPRYQMRLLNPKKVWFDDYGHTEREVCEGPTGFLKATYPHYTSGKGLSRWLDKHNRYSTDEANETILQLAQGNLDWKTAFLGKTEIDRRHALKDISQRMPLRPLIRFFYMYFFLRGCLDGRAGLRWCLLQMFYEYIIVLKVWEIQHRPYDEVYKMPLHPLAASPGPASGLIPVVENTPSEGAVPPDEGAADLVELHQS